MADFDPAEDDTTRSGTNAHTAPAQQPFIIATSFPKQDSATRRLIRSHVMRGVNKGKPRARRATRDMDVSESTTAVGRPGPQKVAAKPAVDGAGEIVGGWSPAAAAGARESMWAIFTPAKLASEISLTRTTAVLTRPMQQLIYESFTIIKPALYVLWSKFRVEGETNSAFCVDTLSLHPAMVPITLFAAQSYRDQARGQASASSAARAYFGQALRHLQQSLDSKADATSYPTMVVVTSMAAASLTFGELETTQKHLDGLERIIQVRGGLASLPERYYIEHKAQAIGLGLAMATGKRPRLFQDKYSEEGRGWGCEIAQGRSARHFPEFQGSTPTTPGTPLDPRLLYVWADLREFSRLANEVTTPTATTGNKNATRIPIGVFSKVGSSIPYRLTQLEFPPTSLEEVLRLSMLAYAKTLVMRLKGFLTRLDSLADKVKPALEAQLLARRLAVRDDGNEQGEQSADRILLWAVFAVTVALCEDNIGRDGHDDETQNWCRSCLVQILTILRLRTYTEVKAALKQFLWVDLLHDRPAKVVLERVQREMT